MDQTSSTTIALFFSKNAIISTTTEESVDIVVQSHAFNPSLRKKEREGKFPHPFQFFCNYFKTIEYFWFKFLDFVQNFILHIF